MALKIQLTCINCDVCEPACPNQAIYMGADIYHINPQLCTECVGHFDEAQCQVLCPVDNCIVDDELYSESREALLKKFIEITKT